MLLFLVGNANAQFDHRYEPNNLWDVVGIYVYIRTQFALHCILSELYR